VRKWFLDMSIATRLGLGFGALVFLVVIFGHSALHQMNRLEKQSDILYHHPLTVTRSVDAVVIEALKIHREMKDLAHTVDRDKIRAHESRVSTYEEDALRNLEMVKSQFLGDPQIVMHVYQLLVDWGAIRDEVIRLRLEGDLAAADAITRGKGARHVALIESELKGLRLFAAHKADESLAKAEVLLRESTMIIRRVLAATVLLGLTIAIPITRSIRNPLTRLNRAAVQVSQGDLEQQVVITSQDELGRLG
jgi:methyl-accepting chemotaxis protein